MGFPSSSRGRVCTPCIEPESSAATMDSVPALALLLHVFLPLPQFPDYLEISYQIKAKKAAQ